MEALLEPFALHRHTASVLQGVPRLEKEGEPGGYLSHSALLIQMGAYCCFFRTTHRGSHHVSKGK